jgi:hypothetical protein
MTKRIISARPNSPVLDEFLLSVCEQDIQRLMKCSLDDLVSFANDLFDDNMNFEDIPVPTNGKDLRESPVSCLYALSVVMGETLNAVKALGGDSSALVERLRKRRQAGEQIGRWRSPTPEEIQ